MLDKNRFQELYENPSSYSNEYERGIVHGMSFLTDKLIWGEQYYLDAREATNPKSMGGKENLNKLDIDMFKIINDQLQNYYVRANGYNLFNDEKSENEYKELLKNIGGTK